ncbi:hypothetical protein ACIRBX_26385 [Kitasatospora sp. NPDC096147]|uniref:hypothetical protein n=1 Tax=Kitasatospora sp. NPDC096147 TaxID=3364093 RepID=UPI003826697A
MTTLNELLTTSGQSATVDSFALYRIATSHSPEGDAARRAVLDGALSLSVSAVAVSTAAAMKTCWDEDCPERHRLGSETQVRAFCELPGVRVVPLELTDGVATGRLYAVSSGARIEGVEVLSSCHSLLIAEEAGQPLLTSGRARYCYGDQLLDRLDRRPALLEV